VAKKSPFFDASMHLELDVYAVRPGIASCARFQTDPGKRKGKPAR
jgi:hypothetical protein